MGDFARDISKFCRDTETTLELACKKVVFDLYRRVLRRSPVDTGRFRANNQIALNSMPSSTIIEFDKDGNAVLREGKTVLQSFKLGDTAFIYNNVAYALALEYGHSKQAPSGVYRISLQEIMSHFEQIAGAAA
jgi:hypothetical protein